MVNQAYDRRNVHIPQALKPSVMPLPARSVEVLRCHVLPQNRIAKRPYAKLGHENEIILAMQMPRFQNLVTICVADAGDRAFKAAPNRNCRVGVVGQTLSSAADLSVSSGRREPSVSSMRRKVASACPTT